MLAVGNRILTRVGVAYSAHLLDKAQISARENGAKDPVVGAVMGRENPRDVIMAAAMNPQHAIDRILSQSGLFYKLQNSRLIHLGWK